MRLKNVKKRSINSNNQCKSAMQAEDRNETESGIASVVFYSLGTETRQAATQSVLSGQERFHCTFPACSKSYTQKQNLKGHINAVHTQEFLYICIGCRKEFYRKSYLVAHFNRMHGKNTDFVRTCIVVPEKIRLKINQTKAT